MKREKVGGGQPVHSRNSAGLFQNLLKRRCIVCDARYQNQSHLVESVKQSHGALYWYLSLEVDQRVQYKSGRSIGIPKRVVQTRVVQTRSLDQIGNQFAAGRFARRVCAPGDKRKSFECSHAFSNRAASSSLAGLYMAGSGRDSCAEAGA